MEYHCTTNVSYNQSFVYSFYTNDDIFEDLLCQSHLIAPISSQLILIIPPVVYDIPM